MMSLHHIEEISSGCGDRVSLTIRWNDARMVVHLDPSATGKAKEDSLIEKYNTACNAEDYEEEEVLSEKILDIIVEVGRSTFDELAPRPNTITCTSPSAGLHSLLFPKEHTFRLRTLDDTLKLLPSAAQESMEEQVSLVVSDGANLPRVSTRDIQVLEKLLGEGYIARVSVNGQEMCSKVGKDFRADSMQRELTALLQITISRHADDIRVPKLRGLVQTPDGERIIGLLVDYVPSPIGAELSSLRDIKTKPSIAEARKKKWATHVQETVRLLHQTGVTWGDGKASNVLIDNDTDDAWVVDFGGGWTDGWVDKELSGTVEGDELAVRKILDLLGVSRVVA